jgi:hypothetical protein
MVLAIILIVLCVWVGYRLWMLSVNEQEDANHREAVREGQRWLSHEKARMREEALKQLYDVTEYKIDRIARGQRDYHD